MRELARAKIIELLQDLIMFTVYLVLLYIVLLANRDSYMVYSQQNMEQLFIFGKHNRTKGFMDIVKTDE